MVPTLLAVQDAYWPASRVRTEASRQAAGELKQRVLAQLQSLGGEAEQLRRAVEQFRPFGGLDQPLDPDLIRLQERANPRLVGDYELVAPARPKHILIIGMTMQAGKLPIGEAPVGSHSVDPAAYLEGADKAWLYLIGPQGSVRRTGVAAFNARRLDVLPGSTVFVPVDPDRLDERTRTLNDDIVKLLAGGEEWTHE